MRISSDQIEDGKLLNGFDYEAQAWVVDGVYQDCGHPDNMKAKGCCNAHRVAGKAVKEVQS